MNNRAPELSPEARRIISAASGFDEPTPEDRERVKARWLASVAALAGVSSLTEAARAAGGLGWGTKMAGAALAIVAGAIGLYFVAPDRGAAGDAVAERGGERSAATPGSAGPVESYERHQKTSAARRAPGEARAAVPSLAPAPVGELGPEAAAPVGRGEAMLPSLEASPPAEAAAGAPLGSGAAAEPRVFSGPAAAWVASSESAAGARPSVPPLPEGAVSLPSEPAVSLPSEPAVSLPSEPAVLSLFTEPAASEERAARPAAPSERAPRARKPRAARKAADAPPQAAGAVAPGRPEAAGSNVNAGEAASEPGGQLGDELALLSEVRRSVQANAPARALELLSGYGARFGRPILGMEADALRVDALCRAGQREAARQSADLFLRKWPDSPLERRVRAACP